MTRYAYDIIKQTISLVRYFSTYKDTHNKVQLPLFEQAQTPNGYGQLFDSIHVQICKFAKK